MVLVDKDKHRLELAAAQLEVEILKEALDKSRSKKPTWLAQSQPKGGSR